MELQHLNVKFFLRNPEAVDLKDYVAIFNTWIQRHVTEDLLIDVADYGHVYAGPGVLLIGSEANYSLDNTGNRLGLLYNRKAPVAGSNTDRLFQALRTALQAAQRLEKENQLQFEANQVEIVVNDRLLAPNTPATLAAVTDDLKAVLNRLYGGADYKLAQFGEPRERFAVTVQATGQFDIATLLKNLAGELTAAKA